MPAIVQAMIAPITPVSVAKRRGNRNTPDPIIEPTTIAVSVGRLTFASDFAAVASVSVIYLTPASSVGGAFRTLKPVKP